MLASVVSAPVAPRNLLAGVQQKQRAVADVIGGRISLLEAADRFRAVTSDRLSFSAEAMCRAVIGWVDLALRDRPERAAVVVERLEQELQSHMARLSRLSVPE